MNRNSIVLNLFICVLSSWSLSAADTDTYTVHALQQTLRNAHATIVDFVRTTLNKQEDAATLRDIYRSTRRIIMRMLSSDPLTNPMFGTNQQEKDRIRDVVHLMYQAIQQADAVDPVQFQELYDIHPDNLIQFTLDEMLTLHDYIATTPLVFAPEDLVAVCQQIVAADA